MTHRLKIMPEYFNDVIDKKKLFEIRKDDRNYEVGDLILLQEFKSNKYTGREWLVQITHLLRDAPQFGLQEGYVILSIK
jgi:hypothetical protein